MCNRWGTSWMVVVGGLLIVLIGACAPAATPVAETIGEGPGQNAPKLLATVYASPTPDAAQREATRLAIRPVTATPRPTNTPAPTAYVGIFLGDAAAVDPNAVPLYDSARYEGTLIVPITADAEVAGACPIAIDGAFGSAWSSDPTIARALGCPSEQPAAYVGSNQIFERGAMYWIPTGEIWTIVPGGTVGGRFWYVAQAPPEQTWDVPAPEGLRLPTLGFGAVWRAVEGVRQMLGFARTDEQAASLTVQKFEGGALLLDSSAGQVFALVGRGADGVAHGPY